MSQQGFLGRITGQFRTMTAPPPPPKYQPVGPSIHAGPEPAPAPQPVPEVALKLDERSKGLLTQLSQGSPSSFGYGSTELARDLLRCERSVAANGREAEHNRAIVQRLAMVSRMIASVDADPNLSPAFKAGFERLRFTLMKSALADASFLTQPQHPLRAIAAELSNRAAEAGPDDVVEGRRLEDALQDAITDFDLAAAFVQPIMHRLRPLDLNTIRDFWAQVEDFRDQRAARRRARKVVTSVVASRLTGVAVPAELRFVVEQEWAAVLTWRLVQSGTSSDSWREGVAWLEHLLSWARAAEPGQTLPAGLMARLEAGLLEAGRAVGPATEALEAMRRAPAKPERTQILTDSAQIALPPLGRLLYHARWFRVFDHQQQKVRWLQATRYDAAGNLVEFAEMDGCNLLRMACDQFLQDLKAGLSLPNIADEQANALMAEIRAAA